MRQEMGASTTARHIWVQHNQMRQKLMCPQLIEAHLGATQPDAAKTECVYNYAWHNWVQHNLM
jgi:hypothetical protein